MAGEVARYFDANARGEWERMDKNEYMRIAYMLHMDFIADALRPGCRVLDAGGGSGRYTVELARRGCEVTLVDISPEEVRFAGERLAEAGLGGRCLCGDIRELGALGDGEFDLTLCYGAPLSYCTEGRDRAVSELMRVTRPGGTVAVSVNGVWGILRDRACAGATDFFSRADYWKVFEVAETGDCPAFEEVGQPARHFFTAQELRDLMEAGGLEDVELGAAPCLCGGLRNALDALCADAGARETIRQLELRSYRDPALVGFGEFLLARGRVPER